MIPGVALGVSMIWDRNLVFGGILAAMAVVGGIAFSIWWSRLGCYRLLSKERRLEIATELKDADREMRETGNESSEDEDSTDTGADEDDDQDEGESEENMHIC